MERPNHGGAKMGEAAPDLAGISVAPDRATARTPTRELSRHYRATITNAWLVYAVLSEPLTVKENDARPWKPAVGWKCAM
jgi:hypothetical protein